MTRAAILAALLTLSACTSSQAQSGPTPESSEVQAALQAADAALHASGVVTAGLNETADLGGGLTVRPIAVIEDSRCPVDVTCVWAGRLRLRANISGSDAELTLGEPNGAVVLTAVTPAPIAHWPSGTSKPAYRFGFRRQ